MRRIDSVVPFAAVCGASLCFSLASAAHLAPTRGAAAAAAPSPGNGSVALGAAVAPVRRAGGAKALRLPGRVALDEARVYRIDAGTSGSIRDVARVASGSRVRKGQVLGSFYAPEAVPVLQVLLVHALGYDPATSRRNTPAEADASRASSSLYQANMQRRAMELENMGVPAVQRAEIARTGRLPEAIEIVAPADGVVLERNVSPGLKFDRGFELFRIANLARVWVVADVFPQEAGRVHAGARAVVSVPELELAIPATIERVLPAVDPATRTTKVRLEVDNAGGALLPGMFVEVRVDVELAPAVVVPAGAVVDSGLREAVYVQSAGGAVEPRTVRTGWRSGDRVQVVDGLAPGEQVVTAGAFLLDSESRLPAAGGAAAPVAARVSHDRASRRDRTARAGPAAGVPRARGAMYTYRERTTFH